MEQLLTRRGGSSAPLDGEAIAPASCAVLAVVAHWRGDGLRRNEDDEPLLRCLDGLLGLPVGRIEVVVLTDRDVDTARVLMAHLERTGHGSVAIRRGAWERPNSATVTVTVERWRPRWPYRHGFYLTWGHKRILRRALRSDAFTHLLYLEDDIGFGRDNLAYWLSARPALAPLGLIPGFVRFERFAEQRFLVDQSRSGQHEQVSRPLVVDGLGEVEVRRSRRPYQAFLLLDAPLAERHLHRSAMRSPLRSAVSTWGVRERAAAGETFGQVAMPLRSAFKRDISAVVMEVRHAVLVAHQESGGEVGGRLIEGALVEHLRPTYAADPSTRSGKVPVGSY